MKLGTTLKLEIDHKVLKITLPKKRQLGQRHPYYIIIEKSLKILKQQKIENSKTVINAQNKSYY
jgi:hypothetical protein